jgi:hypothetical protein
LCTMPEESNRQVLYHHWKKYPAHTSNYCTLTINPEFICTYLHKPHTSTYEPCLVGGSARILYCMPAISSKNQPMLNRTEAQ